MPRTRLATRALTGLLIEDVVQRAGGGKRGVADALAGVQVEVSVRAAVLSLSPALTHTLTGFHIQLLIWATHIC